MNLSDRAKNIVLTPRTEWPLVDGEPTTVKDIYTGYVVPLALIPAVAGFIGSSLIGVSVPGLGTVRTGLGTGLASAILQFGLSLALVYAMALVIDALAPTFGGRKDMLSAFKVAAYSMTPTWLAGIFAIIPAISFLSLLGLYGVYLLYLGLPRLMRAPEDKAVAYTTVVVLAAVVLSIVLAGVIGVLLGRSIDL
jgi:hypothetical protein